MTKYFFSKKKLLIFPQWSYVIIWYFRENNSKGSCSTSLFILINRRPCNFIFEKFNFWKCKNFIKSVILINITVKMAECLRAFWLMWQWVIFPQFLSTHCRQFSSSKSAKFDFTKNKLSRASDRKFFCKKKNYNLG